MLCFSIDAFHQYLKDQHFDEIEIQREMSMFNTYVQDKMSTLQRSKSVMDESSSSSEDDVTDHILVELNEDSNATMFDAQQMPSHSQTLDAVLSQVNNFLLLSFFHRTYNL